MNMLIQDGRQSAAALVIARGTTRLLVSMGFAVTSELPLPSGRRADLVAISQRGEVTIVEIKSCLADFRADSKWPDYRAHCERLFFAVAADFPHDRLPPDTGLIVADAHGAALMVEAPSHPLGAATRKTMLVRFGMASAMRLTGLHDPQARSPFEW